MHLILVLFSIASFSSLESSGLLIELSCFTVNTTVLTNTLSELFFNSIIWFVSRRYFVSLSTLFVNYSGTWRLISWMRLISGFIVDLDI